MCDSRPCLSQVLISYQHTATGGWPLSRTYLSAAHASCPSRTVRSREVVTYPSIPLLQVLLEEDLVPSDMWEQLLVWAADGGHPELLRALLKKGVPVGVGAADSTNASLVLAAGDGHTAAVLALLEAGVPWDARDEEGRTALLVATECGHTPVVRVLLQEHERMWTGQVSVRWGLCPDDLECVRRLQRLRNVPICTNPISSQSSGAAAS